MGGTVSGTINVICPRGVTFVVVDEALTRASPSEGICKSDRQSRGVTFVVVDERRRAGSSQEVTGFTRGVVGRGRGGVGDSSSGGSCSGRGGGRWEGRVVVGQT